MPSPQEQPFGFNEEHTPQRGVAPRNGDSYIFEYGAIMNGQDSQSFAFTATADDVTIKNAVITRYAVPNSPGAFMGAVKAGGNGLVESRYRWLMEDCELSFNVEAGLRVGRSMVVRRSWFHHNGRCGLQGAGQDLLVEDSDMSYSDYKQTGASNGAGAKIVLAGWGGASGGSRTGTERGAIFRNNNVHHNYGHGLWFDIDCIDSAMEGNHVYDNGQQGLFWEISFGGVIRRNLVERCGTRSDNSWVKGAGILIASSEDVVAYENIVRDSRSGILVSQQNRDEHDHQHIAQDITYRNNKVRQLRDRDSSNNAGWAAGLAADCVPCYGTYDPFASGNIVFKDNEYDVDSAEPSPFAWANARRTWAQWKDTYGHDINGVFTNF